MEIRNMSTYLVVSAPITGVLEFHKVKNVPLLVQYEELV